MSDIPKGDTLASMMIAMVAVCRRYGPQKFTVDDMGLAIKHAPRLKWNFNKETHELDFHLEGPGFEGKELWGEE